jgi:putative ABC transport system substrate-binding protein
MSRGGLSRRRWLLAASSALLAPRVRAELPKSADRAAILLDFEEEHDRALWPAEFARHGYVAGKNLRVDFEFWRADRPTLERRARAIVESAPDVVCAYRAVAAIAVRDLTRSIPIVFFGAAEPDRLGLVDNLRSPGRNVTGVSNRFLETVAKRLELLKEMRPGARGVAFLLTTNSVMGKPVAEVVYPVAERLNLAVHEIHGPEKLDTEDLIRALRRTRADAFVTLDWGVPIDLLLKIQTSAGMAGLFLNVAVAQAGGLLSIGPERHDEVRRAAAIAARILRGEKPSQIPVDQLANIYIAVNLKTAAAIGWKVPASVLLRANEIVK